MSVGGFTLVSVISPGVAMRAPSGCGDVPLAHGALARAELAGPVELDGRGLDGRGLGEVELSQLEFAVVDLETTGWSPGAAG